MSIDVEEQYDKIYRYCYFKLHNRQTAEDITQETFLRYFQRYDHVTGREALKCLYTIARNLCIDEYRRRTGERTLEYPDLRYTEDWLLCRRSLKIFWNNFSESQ